MVPKPAKPEWLGCTETEITVSWTADPTFAYRLKWLDCSEDTGEGSDWNEHGNELTTDKGVGQATAPDLQPTSTYMFKLVAIDETGAESEESAVATLDTQVANCTPEPSCNCSIM